MHLRTRQQEQAYCFVVEAIAQAGHKGESDLPSLHELAREAGVGYSTMWKVVRMLVTEGVLSIRPRRGIRIEQRHASLPAGGSRAIMCARASRASEIAARIEHDIATGAYEQGTMLPSAKQLQAAYSACYRTVRAGLRQLVGRGCLVRECRGYRIPSAVRGLTSGTIVLITRSLEGGRLSDITPRTSTHLHHLENVCAQRGIVLDIVPVHYGTDGTLALNRLVSTPRRRDRVLGFVVWTTILNAEMLNYIMASITPLGKPVAILDEVNRLHLLDSWRRNARRYTMAVSPLCGMLVGRYLHRHGHRSVAYITTELDDTAGVASNRRAGLLDVFGRDAVVDLELPAEGGSAVADGLFGSMRDILCTELDVTVRATSDSTGDFELDAIRACVKRFVHGNRFAARIRRCLTELLASQDATAWVCYSDALAIQCKRFLTELPRRAGRRPLVVGFDDSHEAFLERITSYNFNGKGYMHAMVDYILNPRRRVSGREYEGAIELEGFVNERNAF